MVKKTKYQSSQTSFETLIIKLYTHKFFKTKFHHFHPWKSPRLDFNFLEKWRNVTTTIREEERIHWRRGGSKRRRKNTKKREEEEAGNKLYKRTTHGAREGARRALLWCRRNIYDFSVTMAGDLPYVQRLNRSFRMKRIGGSTAPRHVGGASANRPRKDLTLPPPRFNATRPRDKSSNPV